MRRNTDLTMFAPTWTMPLTTGRTIMVPTPHATGNFVASLNVPIRNSGGSRSSGGCFRMTVRLDEGAHSAFAFGLMWASNSLTANPGEEACC